MVLYLKVNLSTVYQGKFSIEKVAFILKGGDIQGFIGRSGSGKSTVIKALVGAINTYNGKIELYDDSRQLDIASELGYSPQENALYPLLTLEENIYTFGKLQGMKNDAIKKRMDMLLDRLKLASSKNKYITQLSGGMQKRADLACALIHDPEIIILDEPFNGIDISLQMFIWDFIKQLSQEGKIIILSSHMLEDLQNNCNQFGLVEAGRYYNTMHIAHYLKVSKEKDLESFLRKIFSGQSFQEK